jgi:Kinesin motor domain
LQSVYTTGTGSDLLRVRVELDRPRRERKGYESERQTGGGEVHKPEVRFFVAFSYRSKRSSDAETGSLLALEKVIRALTEKKQKYQMVSFSLFSRRVEKLKKGAVFSHSTTVVPYRESKLTQILQPSLSGSARVVLIAAINPHPASVEETKSTLKFAARVKKVVVAAEKNEVVDKETLIVHYKNQIADLEAQLAEAKKRETTTSVPPTPALPSSAEMAGSLRGDAESTRRKKEQAAEREFITKQIVELQKLFLNSSNVDDGREGGAPRPVSPTKPSVTLDAAQVRGPLLQFSRF